MHVANFSSVEAGKVSAEILLIFESHDENVDAALIITMRKSRKLNMDSSLFHIVSMPLYEGCR
ncbi:hypothetical protein IMSAGC016_01504 [Muribaculaceae bacterium]|nr:hypothetical protein IMSAGC016_01504 [Muribaculaceae bacterium]